MGLWSSARYDLHLTDAEFWSLTPRQLSALLRRHKQALDRTNYLTGMIASVTANFSMAHPTPPLSASDFMLGRKVKEPSDDEVAEEFAVKFAVIAVRPGVPIPQE
jgi:hypothetical protein